VEFIDTLTAFAGLGLETGIHTDQETEGQNRLAKYTAALGIAQPATGF